MSPVNAIHKRIIDDLEDLGSKSKYISDANEPDVRYKSYGVRAEGKKKIISRYRQTIGNLKLFEQLKLADELMLSGYGEQQSVALSILNAHVASFDPSKFEVVDKLVRLRG